MITDSIQNLSIYSATIPRIKEIVDFINRVDIHDLKAGRHEINEGPCYALIFEYKTKPYEQRFIEAHRKNIDLHIVLSGAERIGVRDISECILGDYSDEHDYLEAKGELDTWRVEAGHFAILLPHEAHATAIADVAVGELVKKMVVKIPFQE